MNNATHKHNPARIFGFDFQPEIFMREHKKLMSLGQFPESRFQPFLQIVNQITQSPSEQASVYARGLDLVQHVEKESSKKEVESESKAFNSTLSNSPSRYQMNPHAKIS